MQKKIVFLEKLKLRSLVRKKNVDRTVLLVPLLRSFMTKKYGLTYAGLINFLRLHLDKKPHFFMVENIQYQYAVRHFFKNKTITPVLSIEQALLYTYDFSVIFDSPLIQYFFLKEMLQYEHELVALGGCYGVQYIGKQINIFNIVPEILGLESI